MASESTGSVLDDAGRRELLTDLQGLGSDADAHPEIIQVFLPLPSHAAILRPASLIVRGERGAGKTALFHVLRELKDKPDLFNLLFPKGRDLRGTWVEGFSERGTAHPSTDVIDAFGQMTDDAGLRAYWFGHLVGVLAESISGVEQPPDPFMALWREHRTEPARWVESARSAIGPLTTWLDHLDDHCRKEDNWLFVAYDHLDKIGTTDSRLRERFSATLLSMWLSLANRYDRLRCKIFLREDLFQASLRGSTDSSKLVSRSVSLHWSTEDLYRVLIRHMAAAGGLRSWLQSGRIRFPLEERHGLGWFPPDALPEEGACSQQAFAEKLAGKLMGSGVKKGYTHRWIPNHLQDAHGTIVPRSILNLMAFAAEQAFQRGPKAQYAQLVHPGELHLALEKTSRYRVDELAQEHPVVQRLASLRGLVLLASRRQIVARLRRLAAGDSADGFGEDGQAAFEEMVRLGVLKSRADGRVDVPDIYRFGFGVKRKGGVARPR